MGLEVKIYDAPAGGIRASHGTFSSCFMSLTQLIFCDRYLVLDVLKLKATLECGSIQKFHLGRYKNMYVVLWSEIVSCLH